MARLPVKLPDTTCCRLCSAVPIYTNITVAGNIPTLHTLLARVRSRIDSTRQSGRKQGHTRRQARRTRSRRSFDIRVKGAGTKATYRKRESIVQKIKGNHRRQAEQEDDVKAVARDGSVHSRKYRIAGDLLVQPVLKQEPGNWHSIERQER